MFKPKPEHTPLHLSFYTYNVYLYMHIIYIYIHIYIYIYIYTSPPQDLEFRVYGLGVRDGGWGVRV